MNQPSDPITRTNDYVCKLLTICIKQQHALMLTRKPSTHSTKGAAEYQEVEDEIFTMVHELAAMLQADPKVRK